MAQASNAGRTPTQAVIAHLTNIGWWWDESAKGRLLNPQDDGLWVEYDPLWDRIRFPPSCTATVMLLTARFLAPHRRRRSKMLRARIAEERPGKAVLIIEQAPLS